MPDEITITEEPEAKPTMTAEDEDDLVRRIMNGEVDPDAPIEQTKAPDTQNAPDTQTKPDASALQTPVTKTGDQPGEVAETLETIREKLKTLEDRYANATKKIGEQGAELGRYRTQQPPVAPVIPQFRQPPGAAPAQEQPFDFTDPRQVEQRAQAAVERALAEREQRQVQAQQTQFMQNWAAQTHGQKAKLAAEKGIPETVIDEAQAQFMQAFMGGKLPEIAYAYANLPTIIQEAETRGERAAIARLQVAQNAPKRAAAASSATATDTGKLEDMSPAELKQYMNSHPDSEKTKEFIRNIMLQQDRG